MVVVARRCWCQTTTAHTVAVCQKFQKFWSPVRDAQKARERERETRDDRDRVREKETKQKQKRLSSSQQLLERTQQQQQQHQKATQLRDSERGERGKEGNRCCCCCCCCCWRTDKEVAAGWAREKQGSEREREWQQRRNIKSSRSLSLCAAVLPYRNGRWADSRLQSVRWKDRRGGDETPRQIAEWRKKDRQRYMTLEKNK